MFRYATDLRSITQGRGSFDMYFERYEEAPPMVAEKVIAEAARNKDENDD
jgi:elongation factor G